MKTIPGQPSRRRIQILLLLWLGLGAGPTGLIRAETRDQSPPATRPFPVRHPERLSAGTAWAIEGTAPDSLPAPTPNRGAGLASEIPVGSSPKLGPNVRLGDDPAALPGSRRAQAEPHVARSVTDTNLLLATFQEGRFEDGGAVTCGFAVSTNGGLAWRRGLIPHLSSTVDGGPFSRASDPVAGVDLHGHLYLQVLGLAGSAADLHATMLLSKSTDGGATFGLPQTILTNSNPLIFLDKNWMTINTFPNTPTANRIVATYTRFDDTDPVNSIDPIDCLYSDDGGATWTKPITISPPVCQGSQPVFLPDGTLVVAYWNFAGETGQRVELVISPDGGATFGAPRVVASIPLYNDPVARSGSFLPTVATDRQLGVLYVANQAYVNGPRILFTRSRDRGLTWTPLKAVNDTPSNRSVFNPAIAVSPDGQQVTIIFYDKRNDTGAGNLVDLYLAESFDGGDTWGPNVRLSTASTDLNRAPLTGSGRMVGDYQGLVPALNLEAPGVAVWVDARATSPDPYAITINRTQGSRFESWRKLAFTTAELGQSNVSGPDADPDLDGIPNLLEYGFGLPPRPATQPAPRVLAIQTSRQQVD